jgi:hypothetical protein
MMDKTILAGSTALLSDVEVEIVDWAVNEIGILMDNPLYKDFIYRRHCRLHTLAYIGKLDLVERLYELYKDLYHDKALLYTKSYYGGMIIHIDQIKYLSKIIQIQSPYGDKYDVKLEVTKDYEGCIRYRLDYKDKYYTALFNDFNIQNVSFRERAICKEFSYSIDEIPNEPIVLRNRNKIKEVEILNKPENETWEDFIYNHCRYGYFNLFLSPNNYHSLMQENYTRDLFGGKRLTDIDT